MNTDSKMASLENVYHDFPRLAKQSGFHFQLHRGDVNWSEIEKISIDEITEEKNFQILERNLINVINCNLEREYDLKMLDKNFVKLFKLAQLGIDYLFYCEMYLDKCVILLQEQLIAFQEKCEFLNLGSQKIKEELYGIERKKKTQTYRCEKCEKVFISDLYLKYHSKRRHSTPVKSERTDVSHKKVVDNWQQTDYEEKLTTSTQTQFLQSSHVESSTQTQFLQSSHVESSTQTQFLQSSHVESSTQTQLLASPHQESYIQTQHKMIAVSQNSEDHSSFQIPLITKIENLELELQVLKEHVRKAKNTSSEKTEAVKSNECHSSNVSGSMHCDSMLMLLPSYLTYLNDIYYNINPRCQISFPEVCQVKNAVSAQSVNFVTTESKPLEQNFSQVNPESKKPFEKVSESAKEESNSDAPVESIRDYHNDYSEYNKENIDPNKRILSLANFPKPQPPPRKSKRKVIRSQLDKENKALEVPLGEIKKSVNHEEKIEGFNSQLIVNRSTPIKKKLEGETFLEIFEDSKDNLSEIKQPVSNSNYSLNSKNSEPETEFFLNKVINKNSPKMRKFIKNFRSSLTTFSGSVSHTEKELNKKESNNQNVTADVVDKLNNYLRRLGVDPEWAGIPKKTLTQKLNVLNHSRKILSKEKPTFPDMRRNIEEKLFQRLKKNLGKKKAVFINKLRQQKPTAKDSPSKHKLEFVKSKNSVIFESDTDSEAKSLVSESNSYQDIEQNVLQKSIIVEDLISECERNADIKKEEKFNLLVFQVGGNRSPDNVTQTSRQKYISVHKTDEMLRDSDVDYNILKNPNDISFITPKELLSYKSTDENTDLQRNYDDSAHLENASAQNPITFKQNTSQSKLVRNDRKEALFANYGRRFEEGLSDSPTDDELWTFENEWQK